MQKTHEILLKGNLNIIKWKLCTVFWNGKTQYCKHVSYSPINL